MTEEALDANYKRAFGKRIGFGARPALILIDFVEAYFDPACPLYAGVEDALASAIRLRDAARAAGVPVIYTNVVYDKGGRNGGRFYQKSMVLHHFIAGSPMGAWPKGLTVGEDELVISKQYPSAFFGTSLAATLTSWGIDTLILTGLSTSGCVRATCVDTCSYGFIPIVVREAVGDRHPAPHEANLFDMDAKYADVVSEAEATAYLHRIGQSQ
ncbi:isochorismatase family protein [Kaistia geumhonensis]|uniref:Maleamate amidohydrolase n=1 Tax=Kaistia geumhonensis TaxID=410839 RepID=A0ABU0M9V4_9HYPH|nr:isochorismatase family protein [Kaistia geumhonensis]MCX5480559.1 isochorismatase family protein [Kaistia geumhonensis]MDQ0517739.1 maleamate amidohydrolase [Kaistia geumhonensis]